MARLPRMYSESGLYFVTVRTFQSRFLITPTEQVRNVLAGVLAKASTVADVQLHGFVALSNHVHLLVTARGTSLTPFMQYFLGNAARKVGRLVGWTGSFWQRRFSAEPVLDDASAVGRLRYLLAHGVKEGLVRTPEEWPGLTCLPLLRSEETKVERFFHWARRWRKGALVDGGEDEWNERWAEDVPLRLVPLPCWARLDFEERQRALQAILDDIAQQWAPQHETVKGAQKACEMEPHHQPRRTKKSPRPLCHVSTSDGLREFRELLRAWVAAFSQASARFREGNWQVEFPPWACRPTAPSQQNIHTSRKVEQRRRPPDGIRSSRSKDSATPVSTERPQPLSAPRPKHQGVAGNPTALGDPARDSRASIELHTLADPRFGDRQGRRLGPSQ